jgi:MFS family permease
MKSGRNEPGRNENLTMTAGEPEALPAKRGLAALPVFYGWVIVLMSALAMLATLPGRSHGLGMITERVLKDPGLHSDQTSSGPQKEITDRFMKYPDVERNRVLYGEVNLWATLLGAAFCIPCGKILDRFGIRVTLTAVTLALGLVVLAMTRLTEFWMFAVAILLTRGLGQSALSVVSLSMVGKWFSRRLSGAMGVYSLLVAVSFGQAFSIVGRFKDDPWQVVWGGLGYALIFGMAPLAWIFVRNTPEECGLRVDGIDSSGVEPTAPATGYRLGAALAEPAFWAFALATSMYGLVTSGTGLFNQDILAGRGFPVETFYTLGKVTPIVGLAGNVVAGLLVPRTSLRLIMTISMALLGSALAWLPFVTTYTELMVYAAGFGLGGGMMTVVFFTAFGQFFGRLHLGQIQGFAQMLTVFASAIGQVLPPYAKVYGGSYSPFFFGSAIIVVGLGLWTCFLKMPASIKSATIPNEEAA